jgi:hypothetical protein
MMIKSSAAYYYRYDNLFITTNIYVVWSVQDKD